MKIQFLGTAAAEGVPAFFCNCPVCREAFEKGGRQARSRSGALIDGVLKLDFGPDTYHHILAHHLDTENWKSVLITHSHEDHFVPSEILYRREGFAQVAEDSEPLTVYGNQAVVDQVEAHRTSGTPTNRVAAKRLALFTPEQIQGYTVTPMLAQHIPNEECFFYLIEKDGKRILYAHDTGFFPEENFRYLAGKRLDLVSLDCTNCNLEFDKGHMGAPAGRRVRARLMETGAADEHTIFVLNHFSHNGGASYDQMVHLAPDFVISYDGMTVEV